LCEDQTKIVAAVSLLDDKLIGFDDDIIVRNKVKACCAGCIQASFQNNQIAGNFLAFVACPYSARSIAPPFLIDGCATANCYDAYKILKRWESIVNRVNVLSLGTDGDPKYLRAQLILMRQAIPSDLSDDLVFGLKHDLYVFQDPIHLGLKIVNRLRRGEIYVIGNSIFSRRQYVEAARSVSIPSSSSSRSFLPLCSDIHFFPF
jgi:hypothetical protein